MNDRQLIADLLSALEYHTEQTRPIEFSKVAIEAAREYLRKPAQHQEPVYLVWMKAHCAWMHTDKDGFNKTDPEESWMLYTSPQPAQRKPLTFSTLCDIEYEITHRDGDFSILNFARAIEAAHGIKENT